MIFIGTGITENYIEKSYGFFDSLSKIKRQGCYKFVMCIGFKNKDLIEKYPSIYFITMPEPDGLTPTKCLQHGAFVKYLKDATYNDTIVFCDTDAIIQRDFSNIEWYNFNNIPDNHFMVMEFDDLKTEVGRLNMKGTINDLETALECSSSMLDSLSIFNTGFIVAKTPSWILLCHEYDLLYPKVSPILTYYAVQQWIISFLIQTKFKHLLLPQETHVHGFYPNPFGVLYERGEFFYDNLIFYTHNITGSK